jgi:hypothetical protein
MKRKWVIILEVEPNKYYLSNKYLFGYDQSKKKKKAVHRGRKDHQCC